MNSSLNKNDLIFTDKKQFDPKMGFMRIFRSIFFWIAVLIFGIYQAITLKAGLISEWIGAFMGSFIVVTIFSVIIWVVAFFLGKFKKR